MSDGEQRLAGGASWQSMADGRLHRLKKGKHYTGPTEALQEEAQHFADDAGKAIRTMREDNGNLHYLWVQFADAEISFGQNCPCGGNNLVLVHDDFARCEACGRSLLLKAARGGGPKSAYRIEAYGDVDLVRDNEGSDDTVERFYGRGVAHGRVPVIVLVDYPLADGARIEDPERPGEHIYHLWTFPTRHFDRARALGLLED